MIYIILYFLIGILCATICRLHDKESYCLGVLLLFIIAWPIILLFFIVHLLEEIKI